MYLALLLVLLFALPQLAPFKVSVDQIVQLFIVGLPLIAAFFLVDVIQIPYILAEVLRKSAGQTIRFRGPYIELRKTVGKFEFAKIIHQDEQWKLAVIPGEYGFVMPWKIVRAAREGDSARVRHQRAALGIIFGDQTKLFVCGFERSEIELLLDEICRRYEETMGHALPIQRHYAGALVENTPSLRALIP